MNIGISVGHHARRHPGHLAVEEDGGRSLTYAELETRSNRLAHHPGRPEHRQQGGRGGAVPPPAVMEAAMIGVPSAEWGEDVRIDVEPGLPRNAIGKIQKQVLRSRYVTPAK